MKKFWTVLIIALVLFGLVFVGMGIRNRRAQAQADPLSDGEVYTVARGEIAEVVEATGNISPLTQVSLSFSTPGELVEIQVATGDLVREGDMLAHLDTSDLELQVAQAEAGLALAHANLDKLLTGPGEEDVAVAQSGLNQAAASRDETQVSLSVATSQARLSWETAANSLRDAQANYENIYWDNRDLENRLKRYDQELPDARVDQEAQAWRAVENAEAAMEQARLSYEQAVQREESSNQSAQAQVVSAQANLDKLYNAVSPEDVAVSQASVDQARISYDLAQANLDKAYLRAPFDGVVATVLAETYNYVSSANPVLVLLDTSSYYIDVEVDEIDIPEVEVGQEVRVFLDALPEFDLLGEVTEVAMSPSVGQGIVTYRVRVQVTDLGEAVVRPGMTANANIVTERAENVLIVPRRAVRIEDEQAYVDRVTADGQLEIVPVELGLGDSFFVEIVSGLDEGEQVLVRSVVERDAAQQFFGQGSGMLGGR